MSITGNILIEELSRVVPMIKTNPEKVEFIRHWGENRALPASSRRD